METEFKQRRMATTKLENVEQNILTCSICLTRFTDPVTLTCQHSYCRKCIGEYLRTKSVDIPGKSIPCPVCNQDIRVPDHTRPVEEWAGQLKPSMVIQGLMDSLNTDLEQKDSTSSLCSLCQKLGETTPGVMWCPECDTILCDNCVQMHRVQPATLHHQLLGKSKKGQEHQAGGTRRKRRKEWCTKHKDKEIEFYCQDCEKSFCYTCYVDHHRKCETVKSIGSVVPQMKSDLLTYRKYLEEEEAFEKTRNTARKYLFDQLLSDRQSARQQIQNKSHQAFQIAMDVIKEKEKKLLKKLDSLTDNGLKQLQDDIKIGDIDQEIFQQFGENIDQTLDSDCDMDILRLFQSWKSGDLDLSKNTSIENGEQLISIAFETETEDVDETFVNLNMGDIVANHNVKGSTPVFHSTTDSRVESDQEKPSLRDITVLDVKGVRTTVVTDFNNKCVKSFFTKDNHTTHSKLELDSGPYGITKLKENQVMVAIPFSRQIVTLAVTPDLVLLSTVDTDNEYGSLAVLDDLTIAAGSYDVDLINMEDLTWTPLLPYNAHSTYYTVKMCVDNKGHLLVSDLNKKCVTCVTRNGDVVWRYHPAGDRTVQFPRGITTTHYGDILLVDRDARKVIQLSESGQYLRDVLTEKDGLKHPRGICLDNRNSLFVIGCRSIKEFVFIYNRQ